jgi:hypothetical protein
MRSPHSNLARPALRQNVRRRDASAQRLVLAAAASLSLSACIDDLTDLAQGPTLPSAATPSFFTPLDAAAPSPTPTMTAVPTALPTAPSAVPTEPPPAPISNEPMGRPALTLLHGASDAKTLYFCLVASVGDEDWVSERPLPAGGIAYGEALVVPLAEGFEPALNLGEATLLPIAIAAEPSDVGANCSTLLADFGYAFDGVFRPVVSDAGVPPGTAQPLRDAGANLDASALQDAAPPLPSDAAVRFDAGADAGPVLPKLRVAELTRLLPGSLEERSYLLVASGCFGAPGLSADDEALLCGESFVAARSSLLGLLVPLSRVVDFGKLGLQSVNANLATTEVTVRSNPGEMEGTFLTVASNVLLGGIGPASANRSLPLADLGMPLRDVMLNVNLGPSPDVAMSLPWAVVLDRSGLELRDTHAYSLVLIGPAPGLSPAPFWNPPSIALIDNDPLQQK